MLANKISASVGSLLRVRCWLGRCIAEVVNAGREEREGCGREGDRGRAWLANGTINDFELPPPLLSGLMLHGMKGNKSVAGLAKKKVTNHSRGGGDGGSRRDFTKFSSNHQRWYAKWKLSWSMYTLRTHFCTFRTDLYAQSVLSNKISASELSRESLLRVCCWLGFHKHSEL